ncbi:MAG: aquaporin [Candidatus Saccharibacteria bacterium]|nr:aquaporin [Candidatus Saccharibacteria bacterium]
MANTKSKKTSSKKPSTKPKAAEKSAKTVKTEAAATKKVATTAKVAPAVVTTKKQNPFKGFFARKCDPNENILTIFKGHRIWGAILGELIGTMLLSIVLLTLGAYQPLYIMFAMVGITMAVYAISGAHVNPAVTVGMMASRRVSAIRGILYIVAQVIGAWLGLMIVNAFRVAGGEAYDIPEMTAIDVEKLAPIIFVELIGAAIIGFFFARAQHYRSPKGAFTYAAMIAGGVTIAFIFAIVITSNYLSMSNVFMMNPAIAIMYQIFPSAADNFGALMGDIALAVLTYIIIPMIGSVIGFFLADASSALADEA